MLVGEADEVLLLVVVAEIVLVFGMLLVIKGVNVVVFVGLAVLENVGEAVPVLDGRIEPVVLVDPVVVFELVIEEVDVTLATLVFVVLGEAEIDADADAVFESRIE